MLENSRRCESLSRIIVWVIMNRINNESIQFCVDCVIRPYTVCPPTTSPPSIQFDGIGDKGAIYLFIVNIRSQLIFTHITAAQQTNGSE